MRKLKATIISEIKENTRLFSENLNQVLTTVRTQQVRIAVSLTVHEGHTYETRKT
jgi:hypothetical protein